MGGIIKIETIYCRMEPFYACDPLGSVKIHGSGAREVDLGTDAGRKRMGDQGEMPKRMARDE
jgi:hypothetical protein